MEGSLPIIVNFCTATGLPLEGTAGVKTTTGVKPNEPFGKTQQTHLILFDLTALFD